MPPTHANLLLIGLRASGKTTLGRLVAEALGRPFVDLDDITPCLLAMPDAATALTTLGEEPFRLAEFQALKETLLAPGQVVALGGGTPTAPGAADLLRRERQAGRAAIVYLAATPELLAERLKGSDLASRPSLTGRGVVEEIAELHAQRDPLYRELASGIVEADRPRDDAVARIIEALDTSAG